jgi:hypothetical protein
MMLNPTSILILILVSLFPIGWIVGEVKNNAMMRRVCGVGAFVLALLIAIVVGSIHRLQYNADYGFAAKALFEKTVISLENGRSDVVLDEYKKLSDTYQPTYENRANFDEIARDAAERLETATTVQHAEGK